MDDEEQSKKKRRLSVWGLKSKKNEGRENVFLDPNDDEAERRESIVTSKRRESIISEQQGSPRKKDAATKNASKSKLPPIPDSQSKPKAGGGNAGLSNVALAELYSSCIKLCTENKINQKNSWQLNLIDYMDDVLEQQQDTSEGADGMTNFQAASHAIDASIKIYSCRVDSVHTDTYKVLGGLTRTEARTEEAEEDPEESKPQGEEEQADEEAKKAQDQKKKKKIVVGGVNTLESNPDNLNAKKIDLAFNVDPLFHQTSAAFDEGGARGLLLNHLSVYNGCQLVLDSADVVGHKVESVAANNSTIDIGQLRDLLFSEGSDLYDKEVCPTFSSFQFAKAKNDSLEDKLLENLNTEDTDESNFDAGPAFSDDENEAPGFDAVDNDDAAADGTTYPDQMATNFPVPQGDQADGDQSARATGDPTANGTWEDYVYFNPSLAKNWAGPDHWRFAKNPKAASTEGDEESKKPRAKRKASEGLVIDFFGPPPAESLFAAAGKSALTTLTAAAMKKASEVVTTLPPDMHYDIKNLTQLFNKPSWVIPPMNKRHKPNDRRDDEDEDGEQAANGDFDGGDFAAGSGSDNDEPNNFDAPGPSSPNVDTAVPTNNSESVTAGGLVDEPLKVPKTTINYVKVAKKVDVKALKSTLWTEMCDEKQGAKQKNPKDASLAAPKSFHTLLEGVSKARTEALGDVSVALCFICVLHLANEHGLSLTQNSLEDLTVNPPPL